MAFCAYCGAQMDDGAKFCSHCGSNNEAQAAPAPQPAAAPQPQPQYIAPAPQPQAAGAGAAAATPLYQVSDNDKTLRLIAFILAIVSAVSVCWLLVPLAWMIPQCIMTYKIYKGERANTTTFGVLMLIFTNVIGGILLLVSTKEA